MPAKSVGWHEAARMEWHALPGLFVMCIINKNPQRVVAK